MRLKKIRRPKVTKRSVSGIVTIRVRDRLTWVSSSDVVANCHWFCRYLVVLIVGEESKGDGLTNGQHPRLSLR